MKDRSMLKKIGVIKNLIDQDFIDYIIEHYNKLPKNTNTLIEKDFNNQFKEQLTSKLTIFNEDLTIYHYANYNEFGSGIIRSDGYVDVPESSYTLLIPLVSEYSNNSTIVFNESSDKTIIYNELTELANKGVRSYDKQTSPIVNAVTKNFLDNYLPHLSITSLPFTCDSVLHWRPGTALYWPRNRLYTSAWFPFDTNRKAIVLTVNSLSTRTLLKLSLSQ
jgi:hypothetical protein